MTQHLCGEFGPSFRRQDRIRSVEGWGRTKGEKLDAG
jgi:hypothetical protein